jgi:copper chaperone CopZ
LSEALQAVKGVVKAEASFKDKRAFVVLDETKTPLSALLTVKTRYHTFRLTPLLPIAKADREKAVQALKAVKGVKEVKAVDEGVAVTLKPDETVRYGDLVAALQKAGIAVREQVESSQEKQRQENQQSSQGDDCCSPPKEEGTQRDGCCG